MLHIHLILCTHYHLPVELRKLVIHDYLSISLTNETIRNAVEIDHLLSSLRYGPIEHWDTSAITNMT